MKSAYRIIQILLIALVGLYTYLIIKIDYVGTGWMVSGMITLKSTSIVAMWLVVGLILFEGIYSFNSKNLLFLLPLFYFCVSINFSFVGDQLASYYPVFFFSRSGIFSLFLGGAIVAAIMQYLWTDMDNYLIVLFGAPSFFLFIPYVILGAIASLLDGNLDLDIIPYIDIFPNFGDWAIGSYIIAWVMFAFYIGIRMLDPSINVLIRKMKLFSMSFTDEEISEVEIWDYLKFIIEIFIAYTTIAAGFSLSGIGLTDGSPPVVLLPAELVPISFLVIIPYLLLVTRKSIFGQNNSELVISPTTIDV